MTTIPDPWPTVAARLEKYLQHREDSPDFHYVVAVVASQPAPPDGTSYRDLFDADLRAALSLIAEMRAAPTPSGANPPFEIRVHPNMVWMDGGKGTKSWRQRVFELEREVEALTQEVEALKSDVTDLLEAGTEAHAETEAAEREVARLRAAYEELKFCEENNAARCEHIDAPEDAMISELCERIGYGAVMDAAARLWRRKDPKGAFTVGPPVVTVQRLLALSPASPAEMRGTTPPAGNGHGMPGGGGGIPQTEGALVTSPASPEEGDHAE